MRGTAARVQTYTLRRFTWSTVSQTDSSQSQVSRTACWAIPALFTSTSSPPKRSTAAATAAAAPSPVDTSATTSSAAVPASATRRTVSAPPASSTSATTTRAPSSAKRTAVAAAEARRAARHDPDLVAEPHRASSRAAARPSGTKTKSDGSGSRVMCQ